MKSYMVISRFYQSVYLVFEGRGLILSVWRAREHRVNTNKRSSRRLKYKLYDCCVSIKCGAPKDIIEIDIPKDELQKFYEKHKKLLEHHAIFN